MLGGKAWERGSLSSTLLSWRELQSTDPHLSACNAGWRNLLHKEILCTLWYCALWSHINDWISNLNAQLILLQSLCSTCRTTYWCTNQALEVGKTLTILCNSIWRNLLARQKLCSSTKRLSRHSVLVFSHSCGMSHHTNTLPKNYKSMIWLSTHCSHSCGICLSLHKNLSWSRDTVCEDQITVKWIGQLESIGKMEKCEQSLWESQTSVTITLYIIILVIIIIILLVSFDTLLHHVPPFACMNKLSMKHISLDKKSWPRYYRKSPTVQDVF